MTPPTYTAKSNKIIRIRLNKKLYKEYKTMSSTTNEIIEKLKTLTLLEAAELVSQIEETFGVDASASVGVAAAPGGGAAPEAEAAAEKTTFDVVVESIASDKRVAVLKVIRKVTSLGLAEVKQFTSSLPGTLQEGVSKEDAENTKTELEAAGAVVNIT
uniref:Large ribosomal subunit protein bL12c n=1 Tax=Neodangemannia microcystis TaxID=173495 RepID=A0A1W6EHA2_9CHLO|nr:ribosomal protein L12 [Neodangemannia microcystis]ARK14771.1 ribosomal protein L12 [Neodangemannia microcystis]